MTNRKRIVCIGIHLIAIVSFSQSNNLTGSPYSLFGLGVEGKSNLAGFNGLGNTGVAYHEGFRVNPYNPASLSYLPEKSFIFDIGMHTEISSVTNSNDSELRLASNFSNVAIGFNPTGKWGVGLSLVPATHVGYSLIGIQTSIEGSTETFTSNVLGSGGINEIALDYGYKLSKYFSVGLSASYVFGNVEETENVVLNEDFLTVAEKNHYGGFQLGVGVQYDWNDKLTMGATINLPTTLEGTQDRLVTKSLDFVPSLVEEETFIDIDDFNLPLIYTLGVTSNHIKGLSINLDYTQKHWSATNQEDNIGEYVDQTLMGLGMEWIPSKRGFKYWERVNYRFGINYDSGYLRVADTDIANYTFSAGLGLPFGRKGSMLNISYSYANKGQVEGILIEESTHLLSLNLTLSDIWFVKRKID